MASDTVKRLTRALFVCTTVHQDAPLSAQMKEGGLGHRTVPTLREFWCDYMRGSSRGPISAFPPVPPATSAEKEVACRYRNLLWNNAIRNVASYKRHYVNRLRRPIVFWWRARVAPCRIRV